MEKPSFFCNMSWKLRNLLRSPSITHTNTVISSMPETREIAGTGEVERDDTPALGVGNLGKEVVLAEAEYGHQSCTMLKGDLNEALTILECEVVDARVCVQRL
jgi:hypothetical protein